MITLRSILKDSLSRASEEYENIISIKLDWNKENPPDLEGILDEQIDSEEKIYYRFIVWTDNHIHYLHYYNDLSCEVRYLKRNPS